MDIEIISVEDLIVYEKNSRTHSNAQIEQVANSIREFGFTNPILIDENNVIIAGHGRLEASRLIGLVEVPAIRLSNLSEEQKKALRIADNAIALNASWDEDLLKLELGELKDAGFDIEVIGLDMEDFTETNLDNEGLIEVPTDGNNTPTGNDTITINGKEIPIQDDERELLLQRYKEYTDVYKVPYGFFRWILTK